MVDMGREKEENFMRIPIENSDYYSENYISVKKTVRGEPKFTLSASEGNHERPYFDKLSMSGFVHI
jgi:hypothetical protein